VGSARPLIQTSPREVSVIVLRFLSTLGFTGRPVFLSFTPVSADYIAGQCHSNCEAEHRRTGAEIVFGWTIWQVGDTPFIEAEFHSVVRRGRHLKDITPRRDGEKLILFAPDTERIAVRIDERTWDTWSNHIQRGSDIEILVLRQARPRRFCCGLECGDGTRYGYERHSSQEAGARQTDGGAASTDREGKPTVDDQDTIRRHVGVVAHRVVAIGENDIQLVNDLMTSLTTPDATAAAKALRDKMIEVRDLLKPIANEKW
jgi:hypothetical protein